jgi:catechol 2,3-dioxygenase-like lactoylglutathione lyase family enzyme
VAVSRAPRIARISLTTADADKLAGFYSAALGFERAGVEQRSGPTFARLMGIDEARARVIDLRLGQQHIELVAFATPGEPYPIDIAGNDTRFQHFAIVVSDMRAAYARLRQSHGWTPITHGEPQSLPARSGGVVAFKFRDPEGHPLELLAFPRRATPPAWRNLSGTGPCLGIDHSALSVADTERSVAFYEKFLGFAVAHRGVNQGAEQERLDGLSGAVVDVTALHHAAAAPPQIELLCYRTPLMRRAAASNSSDIAATRLVIEVDDLPPLMRRLAAAQVAFVSRDVVPLDYARAAVVVRDPDGHAVQLQD